MKAETKDIVLVGDSAFAEVAYEYFTHDSPYRVVAFAVNKAYRKRDELFGLPVVDLETIQEQYPPESHHAHIALVYNKLNRNRERLYNDMKQKGYTLANYISSKAFVWQNVEFGDNVFIFEDNTIQPFVKIGSNTVLWSGNHIGHHSTIGDHVFISSHVVISGFCSVGDYTFMGVNSTVGNNIDVGKDCLVGSGALIVKHTGDAKFFRGLKTDPAEVDIYTKLGVEPPTHA